jgi:hypothetical protein
MGAVLAIVVPTVGFGLFALLAMRFGAESRPGFDERPVYDDRPNWFPITRGAPREPQAPPPRTPGITVPRPAASPTRSAPRVRAPGPSAA